MQRPSGGRTAPVPRPDSSCNAEASTIAGTSAHADTRGRALIAAKRKDESVIDKKLKERAVMELGGGKPIRQVARELLMSRTTVSRIASEMVGTSEKRPPAQRADKEAEDLQGKTRRSQQIR